MSALLYMLPIAVILGIIHIWLFWLAAKKSQLEDLETPAFKILFEEKKDKQK